tara:strand:+ start:3571 stop:3783 length:213 start_codon:yes stop_codon:yes gene_type:complete
MSRVKQYYENEAETKVDKIIKNYTDNLINESTAIKDIMDVENVNLLNINHDNVGEVLYYAKEDLKQKVMQ